MRAVPGRGVGADPTEEPTGERIPGRRDGARARPAPRATAMPPSTAAVAALLLGGVALAALAGFLLRASPARGIVTVAIVMATLTGLRLLGVPSGGPRSARTGVPSFLANRLTFLGLGLAALACAGWLRRRPVAMGEVPPDPGAAAEVVGWLLVAAWGCLAIGAAWRARASRRRGGKANAR